MDNQKKVILVIEDEPPMLRILTDTLFENSFATLQANNGEEGLTLALEKHPDLIIVDLLMPRMDGLSLIKKLREDPWGNTVPIIILTNVNPDTSAMLQAIMTHKPAYYFVKSDIKLHEVVEKIKDMLSVPAKTE